MEISLTHFKSLFDNKTDSVTRMKSFEDFEAGLYALSKVPRSGKKSATLISPAVFEPGTTRSNKNVIKWAGWCAVDVDDHEFKGNLQNELHSRFGHWHYVCYSTASSTDDKPKFRLIFPLTADVPNDKIKHFWFALNSELESIGDRQTKDLSRMYYIPAAYSNANNFIFTNTGNFIDPANLMKKFPYAEKKNGNSFLDRLPEEMQKQIIEHRKSKLENTSFHWTSYRDCPFFPRNLENEYRSISNTGWYHKMYQIMVAIASKAIKNNYPITVAEISTMCREFDMETGNWYANRPIDKEADRALEFVYKNM